MHAFTKIVIKFVTNLFSDNSFQKLNQSFDKKLKRETRMR